jgi:hypothetical protein
MENFFNCPIKENGIELILIGNSSTGKSTFFKQIKLLFGRFDRNDIGSFYSGIIDTILRLTLEIPKELLTNKSSKYDFLRDIRNALWHENVMETKKLYSLHFNDILELWKLIFKNQPSNYIEPRLRFIYNLERYNPKTCVLSKQDIISMIEPPHDIRDFITNINNTKVTIWDVCRRTEPSNPWDNFPSMKYICFFIALDNFWKDEKSVFESLKVCFKTDYSTPVIILFSRYDLLIRNYSNIWKPIIKSKKKLTAKEIIQYNIDEIIKLKEKRKIHFIIANLIDEDCFIEVYNHIQEIIKGNEFDLSFFIPKKLRFYIIHQKDFDCFFSFK